MHFYKLARQILPNRTQVWLGNRHKVKRKTIDPMLFDFTHHPDEEQLLYERAPTRNVPTASLEGNPFIDPTIAASYRFWYSAEQTQQIVRTHSDVIIEPTTGWPMGPQNQLFLSLHPSGATPYMPVPPYKAISEKTPMVRLDKIVSLRNTYENGYSHFYTDMISKLALLRRSGISLKDYTLVIAKHIAQRPYADYLLKQMKLFSEFKHIFLQDQEFIVASEALFVNVFGNATNSPAFLDVVRDVKATCPTNTPLGNRKIFLTRGKNRRRTMQNGEEIEAIVAAKGFESVDADRLSLPEQIELFTNCRHLVGIHGAGLVNMLYRYPNTLSLFEICEPMVSPSHGLNAQYHNMTVALGFDYGATRSKIADVHNHSFYMPPERFAADFNAFWEVHGTD